MKTEEAKEYIINHAKEYLTIDGSKRGWICPICGSGTGKNGTGITTQDGIHFRCWAGCFKHSDIIDIIGMEYGLTEFKDKLRKAADLFNITIDGRNEYGATAPKREAHPAQKPQQEQTVDYVRYYRECQAKVGETDYFRSRGISQNTINAYMLGYDSDYTKGTGGKVWQAVIIPTGRESYVARNTDRNANSGDRYRKCGGVRLFNIKALEKAASPIFIVEGEIDALSIIEVGGEAIGLGSTSNTGQLLAALQKKKPKQPLVVSLDNDKAGEKKTSEFIGELDKLEIDYYKLDIPKPYKDANDMLTAGRDILQTFVEEPKQLEAAKLEAAREEVEREAALYSLENFIKEIQESKKCCIPTGFDNLDKALSGGLYAGLYVVGAINSLGKTTFCLQIADQIAQQGTDVLIFSLEMAKQELIAKSVSRITFLKDKAENSTTRNAKTTIGIMAGYKYQGYSTKEIDLIKTSVMEYGKYAGHIYITEGVGNVGITEIREKIKRHINITGRTPVVLIDYLQIIAPADMRATDKQNTDKAVLELKRISRDYQLPVIGISSFNRDNYTAPVNPASFKESGKLMCHAMQ